MTLRLLACLAAVVLLGPNQSLAQSVSDGISLRSCSIVADRVERQYAAAVGVMSTDASVQSSLLRHLPNRPTVDNCASRVSEAFCTEEVFANIVVLLTNSMAAGGPGSVFFKSLDLAEAAEEPTGNPLGLLGGIAGGLTGFISGSNEGFGTALGRGVTYGASGFAIGTGIGAYMITKDSLDTCRSRQTEFAGLSDRLLANGLRAQRHTGTLYGEIRRVVERMPESDAALAEAMIEAMAASADTVE